MRAYGIFDLWPALSTCSVWNCCSYVESKGREEIEWTEWGWVHILIVKTNANGRAMTLEELEKRRQKEVISMYETIQYDIGCMLDKTVKDKTFQEKFEQELKAKPPEMNIQKCKENFIETIKKESNAAKKKYEEKEPSWFTSNQNFTQAITTGLQLANLASSKVRLFLEDLRTA